MAVVDVSCIKKWLLRCRVGKWCGSGGRTCSLVLNNPSCQ